MSADGSLNRLLDLVDYLVDSRVGIINQIVENPKEAGMPDFFHYYSTACNTSAFGKQPNFTHNGGASAAREIALAKAMGESIERYCSALYDYEDMPLETYRSAPFICVSPEKFALYSPQQYARQGFPYVPFKENTLVRWVPATDPMTREHWHIPAAMVYVPYFYSDKRAGAPIVQPISTGLACHSSYDEAAVSGACEIIERDAFTIFWQARLNPPQIMQETLSDHNYGLIERFEEVGSRVTLMDITMDLGVPTILSIASSGSTASPALCFAASCSMDPEAAARKSLEELAHTRRYCCLVKKYLPPVVSQPPDYEDIFDQRGHLGFWSNCDHLHLADYMFSSEERLSFDEIKNLATGDPSTDLSRLCSMVKEIGHHLLVSDVTTPDISELGLSVLHSIIPGFNPLYMGYQLRALGGKRLWTVPQKLGYKGVSQESGDNSLPHPYP